MTSYPVEGALEPAPAVRVGFVQRYNTILQLAAEDPDATLPCNPKQWPFSVTDASRSVASPDVHEGYNVSIISLLKFPQHHMYVATLPCEMCLKEN